MSSGIGESNTIFSPETGWMNPSVLACNAWRGNILKQLITNCRYLLKVVPRKIWSPP